MILSQKMFCCRKIYSHNSGDLYSFPNEGTNLQCGSCDYVCCRRKGVQLYISLQSKRLLRRHSLQLLQCGSYDHVLAGAVHYYTLPTSLARGQSNTCFQLVYPLYWRPRVLGSVHQQGRWPGNSFIHLTIARESLPHTFQCLKGKCTRTIDVKVRISPLQRVCVATWTYTMMIVGSRHVIDFCSSVHGWQPTIYTTAKLRYIKQSQY